MNCKLTAIQIISDDSIDANFEQIRAQLLSLPSDNTSVHHIVLLPENALLFADRTAYLNSAEKLGDGPCQQKLSELAREFNCTLICGSFPTQSEEEERIYTSCLVYSPQGELIEHYHKIHLFDADVADQYASYRESDTFIPGKEIKVVDCGFAKIGLAICYDLRFPSLFQCLRSLDADIIVLPAAFTDNTGMAHWKPLLQARAIENQCYILAANQGGEHFKAHAHYSTRTTYGHSMIIDPWGEVMSQLTKGTGYIQSLFDKEKLLSVRQKMPVFQHNKFSCSQS